LAAGLILVVGTAPAAAQWRSWDGSWQPPRPRHVASHKPELKPPQISKEPFGDIPKGQVQIFISIDQQKLHLYSDGVHVADTSVATGVPALPTPLGVFSVIQKQVFHRSNLYSNAPMPFMQRITWSGVALHEGENIGHRASHGCIRMPRDFAMRLYGLTKTGARVIVADQELKPSDFADAHLFVHKDKAPEVAAAPAASPTPAPAPAEPMAAAASIEPVKTASNAGAENQTVDAVQPASLGLRVSTDASPASVAPVIATPQIATQQSVTPDVKPADAKPADAKPADAKPADAKPADAKPADGIDVKNALAKKMPIAIFISRKEKKIYVRQNFEPLFSAPVTIADQDKPFGTHVFTAMNFLDDHATLRWNVVSMPGELPKARRNAEYEPRYVKRGGRIVEEREKLPAVLPSPQTPAQVLARIEIPQNAIGAIAQLIGPGSSLIVSDQGLGDETGEGTDFIVVMR
jgi:hypothetical protein